MSDKNKSNDNVPGFDPYSKSSLDIVDIQWYQNDFLKNYVYIFLCIISIGFLPVLCCYFPLIQVMMTMKISEPQNADIAVVQTSEFVTEKPIVSTLIVRNIEKYLLKNDMKQRVTIIAIEVQFKRFFTSEALNWRLINVPDIPEELELVIKNNSLYSPYNETKRDFIKALYGINKIILPEIDVVKMIFDQLLNPFSLLQFFAIAFWILFNYLLLSIIILTVTCMSMYYAVTQQIANIRNLEEITGLTTTVRLVLPESSVKEMDSDSTYSSINFPTDSIFLYPGDKIIIESDMVAPCDLILSSPASKVLVDESMLTGESVPAYKVSITGQELRQNNIIYGYKF
jgi:magnesium-transporting ATPase (P-type)